MFEFLSRHKTGLTFTVLIIFLLSTIAAQIPSPDHPSILAWAVYGVVSPFQQGIAYTIIGVGDLWEDYIEFREIKQENAALKKELSTIYQENQKLKETLALVGGEMELKAFQELYEETYKYKALDAVVIGAGVGTSDQTVILNRGSMDGVEVDQGVISPTGIVGKVIRVGPGSCLVQLVTDPFFSMAARLQDSRVRGLIKGTGESYCDLLYVKDTDSIEIGNRVVSSGLERIFPRGVLLGRVNLIEAGEPPLRKVHVVPSADLRSLEWVLIVQWHEEISDQE